MNIYGLFDKPYTLPEELGLPPNYGDLPERRSQEGFSIPENLIVPQQQLVQPPPQPQSSGLNIGSIIGKIGDLMQATGAGLLGQPNPVLQRKIAEAQLQRQEEQQNIQRQTLQMHKVGMALELLGKANIPDEYATKVLQAWANSDPDIKNIFGEHIPNISFQKGELVRKNYQAKEGEIVFAGQPQPAGVYDFKGRPTSSGQFNVTELSPAKETEKSINEKDLAAFLETKGRIRPPTVPADMSLSEAKKTLDNIRSMAQQRITVEQGGQTFRNTDALRKEFLAQSKDFIEVRDSYNRITQSAKNPSPAGDLSMIFAYMKLLDPRSVVRESEFKSAETARPLIERAKLSWDAVKSVWEGEKLTPSARADFINRAQQLYGQQEQSHVQLENQFRGIATGSGLDPDKVIVDLKAKNVVRPSSEVAPSKTGPKILSITKEP